MENDTLIGIIQDHTSMEIAIRMILEALETKKLPPQGIIPCFNDSLLSDEITSCLELASGQKYEK